MFREQFFGDKTLSLLKVDVKEAVQYNVLVPPEKKDEENVLHALKVPTGGSLARSLACLLAVLR